MSHDCQRAVFGLPVALTADRLLKSLTDRHIVVVLFVWCQFFLTVLNYSDLNLFRGSYCIATNKMCNWKKRRDEERLSSSPFFPPVAHQRGPTYPTHSYRSQFPGGSCVSFDLTIICTVCRVHPQCPPISLSIYSVFNQVLSCSRSQYKLNKRHFCHPLIFWSLHSISDFSSPLK